LKDLNSNFTNGVDNLRQFLFNIPADNTLQRHSNECSKEVNYTNYVNCRVTNYMLNLFNFSSISKPLTNLSNSTKELINANDLIEEMSNITEILKIIC
jgi:hypothetical protein